MHESFMHTWRKGKSAIYTANNLTIMKENIMDAESTIRDTDIAEAMMAYTKTIWECKIECVNSKEE